jgi:hypothetical protein
MREPLDLCCLRLRSTLSHSLFPTGRLPSETVVKTKRPVESPAKQNFSNRTTPITQFCLLLDDITRNCSNHWLSATCQSYALIVEHFIGSRNALKTVLPRHLASPCAVIMAQSFSTVSPTLQIDFDVYSREAHAGLAHYELAVARLASAWAWLGLARAVLAR